MIEGGAPVRAIDEDARMALAEISAGRLASLDGALPVRESERAVSDLDDRTLALVKIAALIALDAPPASFAWQVAVAMDSGATPADVLDVLRAVAPQVGAPRVVAAAPEIMLGLGYSLPEGSE